MSVQYTCDGCGKVSPPQLRSFKPGLWYEQTTRTDNGNDREVHACSRECIPAASKKYGTTPLVSPI